MQSRTKEGAHDAIVVIAWVGDNILPYIVLRNVAVPDKLVRLNRLCIQYMLILR